MRAHEVGVLPGEGADDDESETACVDRMPWGDDGGEGFEEGFGGVVGGGGGGSDQEFASGEDGVVRDEWMLALDGLGDD